MGFPDSTRIGPQKVFELKQIETQKRERCHGCIHLPKKFEDSWAEPERRCNHPREFMVGRRQCWGRKDYGSAA